MENKKSYKSKSSEDIIRIAENLFIEKVKQGKPIEENIYKSCIKEASQIVDIIKTNNIEHV